MNKGSTALTLLIISTGQTDVQLVVDGKRRAIEKRYCGEIHGELQKLNSSAWMVVDAPPIDKNRQDWPSGVLPPAPVAVCTPKLDAASTYLEKDGDRVDRVLILETIRDIGSDPHFAGGVLQRRIQERNGGVQVIRATYLSGNERLEDRADARDAVVRRDVVRRLDHAIRDSVGGATRVIVASTGGLGQVPPLLDAIAQLYTVPPARLDFVEIPEPKEGDDEAVSRTKVVEPTEVYRARANALSLLRRGDWVAAWGTASVYSGEPEQAVWTEPIHRLYLFATALPVPEEWLVSAGLTNMAARVALRAEAALRCGDIPTAIHRTVSFLEAAFDEHVRRDGRLQATDERDVYRIETVAEDLIYSDGSNRHHLRRPFQRKGEGKYKLTRTIPCIQSLLSNYLQGCDKARVLANLVQTNRVNDLRNEVAHDEPDGKKLADAKELMVRAGLWTQSDSILQATVVQDALIELAVENPEQLWDRLVRGVERQVLGDPADETVDRAV